MLTGTPETVTLVPINRIEILNSRDRNMKVFEEIVDNIRTIGLKKPITVAERPGDDEPCYVLVCGEGRLNAFRILGETHIPALVVDVSDEDAFIMSLAENIARRGYRPLEILADIEVLRKRGYSAEIIIQKTGLSPKYVKDIVFLLDQGEERLIEGVQRGTIPLTTALEIARANENAATSGEDGQANLGDLLQEAYENGQLKGRQIIEAKRLIEKRQEHGPASPNRDQIKPPTSSYSLVRTYQREVERQRKMVLKAEHAHQRLLLVVQGLKKLFADEHFVNLLRAEGLDTLPKYLAERINTLGGIASPTNPRTRRSHDMNLAMNPMQPNPRNNLTEMYPGIYQPGHGDDHHDSPNLPTAPLNTLLGFELETYQVPLDQLLPSKKVSDGVMSTRKYKQIVSSMNEVGLIEPLSILHPDAKKSEYLLLDGHLRVLALKELGLHEAPCLFAKDDETYTYNHRVNRLSTIQEHYMIRRAIDRGVSKERLARAFNVNLSSINRRINLLEGICPEAIELLQDKQFTPDVTRILRNMKAARQVEAVELMIASNTITVAHAEALLKATQPEQRTDVKHAEREKKTAPIEQIEKLEKEMSQVQEKYQEAESNYGSDLLNLVVAKGYLTKLLANEAVKSYIGRHEPEILTHLELVVNTVSMEEAVQQQQEAEA